MGGTNGLKETTLSVNVFTAPGKAMKVRSCLPHLL